MKIPMMSYVPFPEGEYDFRIDKMEADENFGEIKADFVTKEKKTLKYNYKLKTPDDEWNPSKVRDFTKMAQAALNDKDIAEVDPVDLVGHFFHASVVHYAWEHEGRSGVKPCLNTIEPCEGWNEKTIPLAPDEEEDW